MRLGQPTLALLALPPAIIAVSLSDFKPRVSDLPSGCQTVYTQSISGCGESDFRSSSCSKGCIEALSAFGSKVKSACGNQAFEGSNIITTFLSGGGPAGLCANAASVLGGGSESSESAAPSTTAATTSQASTSSVETSSTAPSTSSVESTSSAPAATSSSSSAVLSGTTTATSLATSTSSTGQSSSSGILVDTSTVPSATSTSASSTGNAQNNINDNSGGGSPFDSEGNMNSLAPASTTLSLTTAFATLTMVLFAVLR